MLHGYIQTANYLVAGLSKLPSEQGIIAESRCAGSPRSEFHIELGDFGQYPPMKGHVRSHQSVRGNEIKVFSGSKPASQLGVRQSAEDCIVVRRQNDASGYRIGSVVHNGMAHALDPIDGHPDIIIGPK